MLRLLLLLCLVLGSMTSPLGDPDMENLVQTRRKASRGVPSHKVGQLVSAWRPEHGTNPEELGSYQEGDMLLPPGLQNRNGVLNLSYRWPGAVVPYQVSGNFSEADRTLISAAMHEFYKHSCIRFVPYTGEERDFLSIESADTGCWATLGRVGGMQKMNLQRPGCVYYVGTVMHELLHTLGFWHEQSRPDRDANVLVNWNNIMEGQEHNFDVQNSLTYDVKYNYGSVLHYSATAFSKNGQPTLVPKQITTITIGQRRGFSSGDIEKLRAMYKCQGSISEL